MIQIEIPGYRRLVIEHLVSDFTGTLSEDGRLCPGVRERFDLLAEKVAIHVLTADTFGRAVEELRGAPCSVHLFEETGIDRRKEEFVANLGPERVVAVGNGRNDRKMLEAAGVSVAVCLSEGCAMSAAIKADILVVSAVHALDLLLNPRRLIATLRS